MSDDINNANNVEHADHVEHSDTTAHVDNVERLETHDNQPTHVGVVNHMAVTAQSKWRAIADLGGIVTVLAALAITLLSQSTFSTETQRNRALIQQVASHEQVTNEQLTCQARFQDAVDSASTLVTVIVGDLIVIAVQQPAGPAKDALIAAKVADLAVAKESAKDAVNAKSAYNAKPQTPCPIGVTAVTP